MNIEAKGPRQEARGLGFTVFAHSQPRRSFALPLARVQAVAWHRHPIDRNLDNCAVGSSHSSTGASAHPPEPGKGTGEARKGIARAPGVGRKRIILRGGVPVYRWLLLACLSLAAVGWADEEKVRMIELPENPVAGGRLFMEKGCINCHPILGMGGGGAPDLGKVKAEWTFSGIAAAMWNHTPKMDAEFKRRNIVRPQFDDEEMYQLIAFVYFLNYFGNPGDPTEGELIFFRNKCVDCHRVGAHGPEDGTSLNDFQLYRSPAFIVAALWNASQLMTEAMEEQGVPRPVYEANDILDILAFIRRDADPLEEGSPVYLPPPSSRRGAEIFRTGACIRCHSVRGEGGDIGPDLGMWESKGVLSQVASAMWNHGPAMWKAMAKEGVEFPLFSPEEMSDLMTFFFFSSFADAPGDPERGRDIFSEKGCVACHWGGIAAGDAVGPGVSDMRLDSAAKVIAAMWNHASEMQEAVLSVEMVWPQLKSDEMVDIMAFIQSGNETDSEQGSEGE